MTQSFVVCSKCYAIYPIERDGSYAIKCDARPAPAENPCGTDLRIMRKIKGRRTWFPARRYVYQDFRHWLGRLLCRPGLEDLMDRYMTELADQPPEACADMLESQIVRALLDHDGKPFLRRDADEARYVFSFFVDGFQTHGRGGPSNMTAQVIYFTCVNLPLDLRIDLDNIFLAGVFQGHPSLGQINPLLRPIVDDFVDLWSVGVYYTSTPRHPNGKKVLCALITLIADLLAGRQVAGLSYFKSQDFCAYCRLRWCDREDLHWRTWEPRTNKDHREAVDKWNAAQTVEERDRIYHAQGARYSELLRLPYWDPIKFTMADPMHALLINLFGWHVERVWGVNGNHPDDLEGITYNPSKKAPSDDSIQAGYIVLRTGSNSDLGTLEKDVLVELCKREKMCFAGTKANLIDRLKQLVRSPRLPHSPYLTNDAYSAYREELGHPRWYTHLGCSRGAALRCGTRRAAFRCNIHNTYETGELEGTDKRIETLQPAGSTPSMRGEAWREHLGLYADQVCLSRKIGPICMCAGYIHWSDDAHIPFEQRLDAEFVDIEGNLMQQSNVATQPKTTRSRNDPPTEAEMAAGTSVLLHGSSSSLKSLRVRLLAELCALYVKGMTATEYHDSNSKSQLLSKLEEYVRSLMPITASCLPQHLC